tara:strand:- start:141 stop:1454 length:1314 start_codon:yes stop_codon:yes gene_type:complete
MLTAGDALRMMQVGGVDRTGFADMADAIGTPGADLMEARRIAAAQDAERNMFADLLESMMMSTTPGMGEIAAEMTPPLSSEEIMQTVAETATDSRAAMGGAKPGRGTSVTPRTASIPKIDTRKPSGMSASPKTPKIGAVPKPPTGILSTILGLGKYANPFSAFFGTLLSPTPAGEGSDIVPGMEEYMGMADGGITDESFYINDRPVSEETYNLKGRQMDLNPTGQEAFKEMTEKFSDMDPTKIMDIIEGRFPEYMEDPNDPFAGMADGGRVEAFSGGIMNNLLGSPQVQSMIQQYTQPTFDFSQVASPSIPQPAVAPATPPQAYTPFVSTMPLYDPSTLGTGLPSTAGMADPFFVYDPYSPVGAFDAPPARTGPAPLSQDKIMETFKNIDKFDVAKQEAKRKAAEAAAKAEAQKNKPRQRGGGGGGGRGGREGRGGN